MSKYSKEKYKDSFLIYTNNKNCIDLLSDEEAGKLFKSLFFYVSTGKEPTFKDKATKMSFMYIKQQIDINAEKYCERIERQRQNGLKGGAPIGNKNALKKQPKTTQTTLNDNDIDIDNDIVNEYDNVIEYDNNISNSNSKVLQLKNFFNFKNVYLSKNKFKNLIEIIEKNKNKYSYLASYANSTIIGYLINELDNEISCGKEPQFNELEKDKHYSLLTSYFKHRINTGQLENNLDIHIKLSENDNDFMILCEQVQQKINEF